MESGQELNRRQLFQRALVAIAGSYGFPASALTQIDAGDASVLYLTPRDPEYRLRRQLFNQRIALQPAVIAVPSDEHGVQAAVNRARKDKLSIAVKSGGHCFEGHSLNEGGMVIDLALLNTLRLSSDGRLVAGPACKLAQVYQQTLAQGRLLPAGSCGGVGLAGLTLGGGYGLFARQFGLTCDHLMRVRMVDGRGELRDSDHDEALLWACRGGGNGHFGVITQLEYRTQSAPALLHNYRFRYNISAAAQTSALAEFWFEWMRHLPAEGYSAFVANGKRVTVVLTSTLPTIDDDRLQLILAALKSKADQVLPISSKPLREAVKQFHGQAGPLPFKNISAGFYQGFAELRSVADEIFAAVLNQRGLIYQLNTFGPLPAAPASAFAHREQRFIGELQAYWQAPATGDEAIARLAHLQQRLWQAGVRAHYANYPDHQLTDWPQAYYGATNYQRLQQLKSRYDPDDCFRHPQSVALPTVATATL